MNNAKFRVNVTSQKIKMTLYFTNTFEKAFPITKNTDCLSEVALIKSRKILRLKKRRYHKKKVRNKMKSITRRLKLRK